jgi:hypothetical protein
VNTIGEMIGQCVAKITKDYTREKKRSYSRSGYSSRDYVSQRTIDRWNKKKTERQLKKTAYEFIEQAYNMVSDNGKLPANRRQILYKVRPYVLEKTGEKWSDDRTFTQGVLEDFLRDNRELTADWDIVADARGHFTEPHVKQQLGIGTLEVRSYCASWGLNGSDEVEIDDTYPTHGPADRYKFALFIEKEGFDPLLAKSKIAHRYDISIFSSKGQSTVATRQLVDKLAAAGVTILVLHDFDIAGFRIIHWLSNSNERYSFKNKPKVIDLGLRLKDVEELGLESEEQLHKQDKDPTENFTEGPDSDDYDVTEAEVEFLRGEKVYAGWRGRRVELNAIPSSQQFIDFLERKLDEAGVTKVVPGKDTLKSAWKRAVVIAKAREAIEEAQEDDDVKAPRDLKARIRKMLEDDPALSWDTALVSIAEEHLEDEE